jgi:hypothetical protein
MTTPGGREVRQIPEGGDPMVVDPATVGCGFLLFPKQMSEIIKESHVHQALWQNKAELWAAVRRVKPNLPVALMTTSRDVSPSDAVSALDQTGRASGHSIALDIMKMSPDGGRTLVDIYVGFTYEADVPEVVVAGPQMIRPGKPRPRQATAGLASQAASENAGAKPTRPWWAFWR